MTTPSKGQPRVDEVLNDLISIVPTRFENKTDLVRVKHDAKASLLAHAISCLPEKYAKKRPYDGYGMIGLVRARHEGFDQAVDLMEQKLREGYGE